MDSVNAPDIHFLNAAAGWLELGNAAEAKAEFRRISKSCHQHPEVLSVRWMLLAAQNRWSHALKVSRQLIQAAPDHPFGWIHQSYSLHELRRTHQAWRELLNVADRFPGVGIIPYNLSCYACRLGYGEEAQYWLKKAITIQGLASVKSLALEDTDLAPLHDLIRTL